MAPPPFLERAATAAVVVVAAVSVTVEIRQVIIGRTGLGNVLDGHEDERIAAVGQMETAGVDIGISRRSLADIAHPADEIGPESHAAAHSQDEGHGQGQGAESIGRVIGLALFLVISQ